MPEAKYNPIPGVVPLASELHVGELAVNTGDGKLYVKMSDERIQHLNQASSGGQTLLQTSQRAFAANLLFG